MSPHARENSLHHQLRDPDPDLRAGKNQKETKRRKEKADPLRTDRQAFLHEQLCRYRDVGSGLLCCGLGLPKPAGAGRGGR